MVPGSLTCTRPTCLRTEPSWGAAEGLDPVWTWAQQRGPVFLTELCPASVGRFPAPCDHRDSAYGSWEPPLTLPMQLWDPELGPWRGYVGGAMEDPPGGLHLRLLPGGSSPGHIRV